MSNPFFDHPILNSPYECPQRHWELDSSGQPTQRLLEKRRRAEFITPIPKPKKRKAPARLCFKRCVLGGAPLTIASAHNGTADIRAPRKLAIPRVIREKESFAYKYLVPRAQRNTSSTAATFTSMSTPALDAQ